MSQGSHIGTLAIDRSRRCAVRSCPFFVVVGGTHCQRHAMLLAGQQPAATPPAAPPSRAAAMQEFSPNRAQVADAVLGRPAPGGARSG